MFAKYVIACAAVVGASTASAAPFGETEILTTGDGSVWYLKDSTVKRLVVEGRPVLQFFIHSDNPPSSSVRHWAARIYLDCPSQWFVRSIVAGYDANDKVTTFTTKGWARANWEQSDASGVVAAAAKAVCPVK